MILDGTLLPIDWGHLPAEGWGEEFIAALWATMPGAAERPTGWPAVGGELGDTP